MIQRNKITRVFNGDSLLRGTGLNGFIFTFLLVFFDFRNINESLKRVVNILEANY